jgi:hypothetical protein
MTVPVESFAPTAVPADREGIGEVRRRAAGARAADGDLQLLGLVRVQEKPVRDRGGLLLVGVDDARLIRVALALVQVPRVLAVLVGHDVPMDVLDREVAELRVFRHVRHGSLAVQERTGRRQAPAGGTSDDGCGERIRTADVGLMEARALPN